MLFAKIERLTLSHPNGIVEGTIELERSKSLSNRALIIQSLCQDSFEIKNLSTAQDTITLSKLLSSNEGTLDVGAAGTTFRFLTALLSQKKGTQILTGSERMLQRPVGHLVEALRSIGADIKYVENEGFPPLAIGEFKYNGNNEVKIPADTSSQFISALAMIAPTLPNGLKITLDGNIVSKPYIDMTLAMMQHFGVSHQWEDQTIVISSQKYLATDFTVEADWSAASYYYSIAAIAKSANIKIIGLAQDSLQSDAMIVQMGEQFGVTTEFLADGILLTKPENAISEALFEMDFTPCPDIAQTLAVMCAAKGVQGLYSGLETLRVKETDRIAALQNELAKLGSFLSPLPPRFSKKSTKSYFLLEGAAVFPTDGIPFFETYEDHRMAMAFAPLALLNPIAIEAPDVVAKSYPAFWKDLISLGFDIKN